MFINKREEKNYESKKTNTSLNQIDIKINIILYTYAVKTKKTIIIK